MKKASVFLFLLVICPGAFAAGSFPTREISLNGSWEYQRLDYQEPAAPPTGGKWLKTAVPGKYPDLYGPHDALQASGRAEIIWYRTRFTIPGNLAGQILKIRFEAVQYGGEVYLNGKIVGKHSLDCRMPEEFDITGVARIGGENELVVSARDQRALVVDGRECGDIGDLNFTKDDRKTYDAKMPETKEEAERKQSFQRDIYPPGSWSNYLGIREDVKLLAVPPVHIEDVWAVTLVEQKKIRVQVTVRNAGNKPCRLKLTQEIKDWPSPGNGPAVKRLPDRVMELPAGAAKVETVETGWDNPSLWWPYDPHLYVLDSAVATGNGTVLHQKPTRFGFREITRVGNTVRLNGRKFHLFGSHDLVHRMTYETAKGVVKHLRAGNVNVARFWHGSATTGALDAFDEGGILVIDEFFGMGTPLQHEKFWTNAKEGVRRRILRDRNHPCVVIWSSNNEYLAGAPHPHFDRRYNRTKLAELGDYIKAQDPTRLVVHEGNNTGEDDLIGNEDVICPHYVGETSSDAYLVPNYFDWLKAYVPAARRPLFMGESVWPPVFGGMEYWLMFDVGEKAFATHAGYASGVFDLGRANLTSVVAERYRYYDIQGFSFNQISAIGPPFEERPDKRPYYVAWTTAVQEAYKPIRSFVHEYDRRFFGGQTVERTVTVHNDSFQDKDLRLQWSLEAGKKVVQHGDGTLHILSGEFDRRVLSITMPEVPARTEGVLRLCVLDGETVIDAREYALSIFPCRVRIAPVRPLMLYDPAGKTGKMLAALNVGFQKLEKFGPLDPKAVLIIGADGWNDAVAKDPGWLWAFVSGGGRVICFEQAEDLQGLPVELTMTPAHPATINFRRCPGHPLLGDIEENDLKYWRGDNIAVSRTFKIPSSGGFRVVSDSASTSGLVRSGLLEIPHGRGTLVFCQFDIHRKLAGEPAAGILVRNLIEYACGPLPAQTTRVVVFAAGESPLADRLKRIGLSFESNPAGSLSEFGLAVVDSRYELSSEVQTRLREFAGQGGTVLLHNLYPKSRALGVLPFDVGLTPPTISHPWALWIEPVIYKINDDPLVRGLSNQSLYWGGSNRFQVDFVIEAKDPALKAQPLLQPSFLVRVPFGRGQFIIDQIKWDVAVEKQGNPTGTVNPVTLIPGSVGERQEGYIRQLLTNLGVDLNPLPGKAVAWTYTPVDLRLLCNMGFADDREEDRRGGWTDQGPDKDLRSIPTGRQTFGGVPFDIIRPETNGGKSCLVLAGGPKLWLPGEIKGIPVNRRADVLCFLHATAWTTQSGKAGYYRVHYADGSVERIELVGGATIQEWFLAYASDVQEPLSLAWRDDKRGVYLLRWRNPHPETEVKAIDFVSAKTALPILLAVTVGRSEGEKP